MSDLAPTLPMREAAIMAAADLLASEGPQGLSMRKIAALAQCSTMVIYHHFGGKQGLLDAVYVEGFARLREAQAQAVDDPDPELQVRARYLNYREVALAHPAFYQVMLGNQLTGWVPDPKGRRFARETYGQFVASVTAWGEECELTASPQSAAYTMWAAAHGLVMLELTGHGDTAKDEQRYAAAIEVLMQGLRASTG